MSTTVHQLPNLMPKDKAGRRGFVFSFSQRQFSDLSNMRLALWFDKDQKRVLMYRLGYTQEQTDRVTGDVISHYKVYV